MMFKHRIQDYQQLSHAGGEGYLLIRLSSHKQAFYNGHGYRVVFIHQGHSGLSRPGKAYHYLKIQGLKHGFSGLRRVKPAATCLKANWALLGGSTSRQLSLALECLTCYH
jgi:hypothetical protein